jgi:putative inorganic carbon (hco3(-)) transporter
MAPDTFLRRLLKENVVLLVMLMLVVVPLLGPFTNHVSGSALRNVVLQVLGVLLLGVLLARLELRDDPTRLAYLVRTGVNAPLLAFLFWVVLGGFRSSDPSFAVAELLRLGTGALIYFALSLHLESRAQLRLFVDCLVLLVVLVTGYGLLLHEDESRGPFGMWAIFPSPHHLSAILAVLLPLLVALASNAETFSRRLAAIAGAVWCAIGLLLCLERSAWIAAAAGLGVLLLLRERRAPHARAARSWKPALVLALSGMLIVIGFFVTSDVDALVAHRARQFSTAVRGEDRSFNWRLAKWRGAAAMARDRPFLGWGPGHFVLYQHPYTHLGLSQQDVYQFGASFDDMAYNDYLQTAAEIGIPGLLLYLLLLASFFTKALRALPRLPGGLRRATLVGCVAGVVAYMIDSAANGSWRYIECSLFFWLLLGLGVAVIRMAHQQPAPELSAH